MDVIVLGLGGMGSAAAYHLARRGVHVLGLEQYPFVHDRGSSHGHTRIIRTAYYEHPNYIPLVRRAFEHWHDLEQSFGRHLLTPCDCLSLGPAEGELIAGVSAAAEQLAPGAVSRLSSNEIAGAYPFRVPEHFEGRLEREAGFLYVEECVRAHLDAARAAGADLRAEEPVLEWKTVGDGVEVTTARNTYRAARLIVTAGAWATKLLSNLGVPLSVMRQTLQWHAPRDPAQFRRDRFPIFLLDTPAGAFYGMPMIDPRGFKLARHYCAPELATPDTVDWSMNDDDVKPVRQFIEIYMPEAGAKYTTGQVCMYTLTPDRHFVIDRHPEFANVSVAAGFSGHGFKFAPVVGEVLADLACGKAPGVSIDMFSAKRFAS
jgi:sarcosine oxidase